MFQEKGLLAFQTQLHVRPPPLLRRCRCFLLLREPPFCHPNLYLKIKGLRHKYKCASRHLCGRILRIYDLWYWYVLERLEHDIHGRIYELTIHPNELALVVPGIRRLARIEDNVIDLPLAAVHPTIEFKHLIRRVLRNHHPRTHETDKLTGRQIRRLAVLAPNFRVQDRRHVLQKLAVMFSAPHVFIAHITHYSPPLLLAVPPKHLPADCACIPPRRCYEQRPLPRRHWAAGGAKDHLRQRVRDPCHLLVPLRVVQHGAIQRFSKKGSQQMHHFVPFLVPLRPLSLIEPDHTALTRGFFRVKRAVKLPRGLHRGGPLVGVLILFFEDVPRGFAVMVDEKRRMEQRPTRDGAKLQRVSHKHDVDVFILNDLQNVRPRNPHVG